MRTIDRQDLKTNPRNAGLEGRMRIADKQDFKTNPRNAKRIREIKYRPQKVRESQRRE